MLFPIAVLGQFTSNASRDLKVSAYVEGSILVPEKEKPPIAILIGGSGPVDRNGNQPMVKNNSLKFLAEGLYKEGIASFRYDKRIVKQLQEDVFLEENVRFEDFIQDAKDVVAYFKRSNAFSKIIVIGHSQGSLVGMIAAQSGADAYISVAGAGQEIDDVIVDQIEKQSPGLKDDARTSFDDLRANGYAANFNPYLASIFRESLQPFLISWMKYNPQTEIKKLNIPVLIVSGNRDLQVMESEAELLKEAKPDAEYKIIDGMNHIFKKIKGSDDIYNSKTYNDPSLPVMPELIETISEFIKS